MVCAQSWWAMFGLRKRHDWSFDQFLVLLAQTVVLYLVAGLIYPNFKIEGEIDVRAHYFAQRKRFFRLLIIATLVSLVRDLVIDGHLPEQHNLAFHLGFIVLSIIGLVTANEWTHRVLAVVGAVAFVEYITTLFVRLR
jgi:ABC-type polysaccharide/polyol phosphate export permease